MGFEYGYSLTRPDVLVLRKAQFGDFANSAQTMVGEYLASAKQKWGTAARPERFLQLCAQDNMTVAAPHQSHQSRQLLPPAALAGAQPHHRPLVVLTQRSSPTTGGRTYRTQRQ
jgi:2-oxoglutarate dehydrogenase E1 component